MQTKLGILGGGITGLTTALFQKIRNPNVSDITIFEASPRIGGWINTQKSSTGCLFENGTRTLSLRPHHLPSFALMMSELKIMTEGDGIYGIIRGSEIDKNKYISYRGKPLRMPVGPISTLSNPITRRIPQALLKDLFTFDNKCFIDKDDVSVYDLIATLDPTLAEYLAGSFINGIYGGDLHHWSANMVFGDLLEWKKRHGSFIRGALAAGKRKTISSDHQDGIDKNLLDELKKYSLITFHGGMSELVEKLERRLKQLNVEICLNKAVTTVELDKDDSLNLTLTDGTVKSFDNVISALPAHSLANIFPNVSEFSQFKFTDMCVLQCVFPRIYENRGIKPTMGILFSKKESTTISGIIFDSIVFPQRQPEDKEVVSIVVNDTAYVKSLASVDLKLYVCQILEKYYGKVDGSELIIVQNVFCKNAMPKYLVGHEKLVGIVRKQINDCFKGKVKIIGSSFDGIGVPDCIKTAFETTKPK